MDSAVRMSRAVIAMHRSDFAGVLDALGHDAVIPFSDKYDSIVLMYRAHSLERLHGPDRGIAALLEDRRRTHRGWRLLIAIAASNAKLGLCAGTLPVAVRRANTWAPAVLAVAVYVVGMAALMADQVIGPSRWEGPVLREGGYVLAIFWTLFLGIASWGKVSARAQLGSELRALRERKAPAGE